MNNWPRIVQIAWIITDAEGNILKSNEFILKQMQKIPSASIDKHGITDEIAEKKGVDPLFAFDEFCKDLHYCDTIVAHNLEFDYPIIETDMVSIGN